jgi:hypothetical protein
MLYVVHLHREWLAQGSVVAGIVMTRSSRCLCCCRRLRGCVGMEIKNIQVSLQQSSNRTVELVA